MDLLVRRRLRTRPRSAFLLILTWLTCWSAYTSLAAAQQDTEDIYNHKCAVCHGKDGLGKTMKGKENHVKDVHDNMKDSEPDMIKVVTEGKGENMDAYKSAFTPEQIKALVEYYRSLGQK